MSHEYPLVTTETSHGQEPALLCDFNFLSRTQRVDHTRIPRLNYRGVVNQRLVGEIDGAFAKDEWRTTRPLSAASSGGEESSRLLIVDGNLVEEIFVENLEDAPPRWRSERCCAFTSRFNLKYCCILAIDITGNLGSDLRAIIPAKIYNIHDKYPEDNRSQQRASPFGGFFFQFQRAPAIYFYASPL